MSHELVGLVSCSTVTPKKLWPIVKKQMENAIANRCPRMNSALGAQHRIKE